MLLPLHLHLQLIGGSLIYAHRAHSKNALDSSSPLRAFPLSTLLCILGINLVVNRPFFTCSHGACQVDVELLCSISPLFSLFCCIAYIDSLHRKAFRYYSNLDVIWKSDGHDLIHRHSQSRDNIHNHLIYRRKSEEKSLWNTWRYKCLILGSISQHSFRCQLHLSTRNLMKTCVHTVVTLVPFSPLVVLHTCLTPFSATIC